MKKLFWLIHSLLLCVSLCACGGEDSKGTTEAPLTELVCTLTDGIGNFKTHGRTTLSDDGLICDHSATGIEFSGYMEGDVEVTMKVTGNCYFTVFIDGVRSEKRLEVYASPKSKVKIASFPEAGNHTIKLLKQTEASKAQCLLIETKFTGYFEAPPAENDLLIEFLGDSITAGMGNLCANGVDDAGNALYQDGTKTYAYLTAQELNTDVNVIARSGIGIAAGHTEFVMSEYFAADSYYRDVTKPFTPVRVPDIVVINLGTNDAGYNVATKELKTRVIELVNLVRNTYEKEVTIVWVHGMMSEGKWSVINEALEEEFGGESGGIYSFEGPLNREGGANHPNEIGHQHCAQLFAMFLKEKGLV